MHSGEFSFGLDTDWDHCNARPNLNDVRSGTRLRGKDWTNNEPVVMLGRDSSENPESSLEDWVFTRADMDDEVLYSGVLNPSIEEF
mmetsp:Transcript_14943/g.23281  ORF Transcript_14943/g.23281 Transcript_14943/m.23281 type:complete len:86 (+) Transcript_14943:125-382(+)